MGLRAALLLIALAGTLAACGGDGGEAEAQLPAALASRLAAGADLVAVATDAGDPCAAAEAATGLQRDAIAAVNAGKVPAELQEELLAGINRVASSVACVPPPAPPPVVTTVPDDERSGEDDEDRGQGKRKGRGKGKQDKHDDEGEED